MKDYQEPELTIAVLDFKKPLETLMCLRSIKEHVKIPHKVILCDNGSREAYFLDFLREGLVDQLIVNDKSLGLGIGTRDVINAVFSPYFASVQNDQYFSDDLDETKFNDLKERLENHKIGSISLAGAPCGENIFSERAFIMKTNSYKDMEKSIPLSYFGAGPLHAGIWRESQIQTLYKEKGLIHFTQGHAIVTDNGVFAVRDMGDGGVWCHRTDTKNLYCIVPPKIKNPAYPKINDIEFTLAKEGKWPEEGKIPEQELVDSFDCWSNTPVGMVEKEYVTNLRERTKV